jgi:hypothetical protein
MTILAIMIFILNIVAAVVKKMNTIFNENSYDKKTIIMSYRLILMKFDSDLNGLPLRTMATAGIQALEKQVVLILIIIRKRLIIICRHILNI